jgi:SAM-dependent methyltransferase
LEDDQIEKIRRAYNLTVTQHSDGTDPLSVVPKEFRESAELAEFFEQCDGKTNSAADDIKSFLQPAAGMKYLDAGCSANLYNYRLHTWPSVYYGIDISEALIDAMRNHAGGLSLSVGELKVAEITSIPFPDKFFDIASLIGVLEYYTLEYAEASMREFHRVLKPEARLVLDIPNRDHRYFGVMERLEGYLQRPIRFTGRVQFEKLLRSHFDIKREDDSSVMIKYFLQAKPT